MEILIGLHVHVGRTLSVGRLFRDDQLSASYTRVTIEQFTVGHVVPPA